MPVHDWRRVDAGIFHAFHLSWLSNLASVLNDGLLPPEYYALIELRHRGSVIPPLMGQFTEEPVADLVAHLDLPSNPMTRFRSEAGDAAYWNKKNRIVVRHEDGHIAIGVIEIVSAGDKAAGYAFRRFVDHAIDLITSKVHLLVVDLNLPTRLDPRGMHAAIWEQYTGQSFDPPEKEPLTLVAYQASDSVSAYVEPTHIGAELRDMPLFLMSNGYTAIPLEQTYQSAYRSIPQRWRRVVEGSTD
jgi:hypothetical protein